LQGTDVTALFPKKYADIHKEGKIFFRFMLAKDTNKLQKRTGMSFLMDAQGFIISFTLKIRMIIDDWGELFLLILAQK
jgi:hypothetical protein